MNTNLSVISSASAALQLELDAKDATIADLQGKANRKTWNDLERSAWLLAPGALANTGSTGSLAEGFQVLPDTNCGSIFNSASAAWCLIPRCNSRLHRIRYESGTEVSSHRASGNPSVCHVRAGTSASGRRSQSKRIEL